MSKRPKDTSVGPWAREKLDSLRKYLEYYTTRLKNQAWCKGLYYIDGFAGPGFSPIRSAGAAPRDSSQTDLFSKESESETDQDEVEYVKGSPRVALEIKNPFNQYIFIENDSKRVEELKGLQKEFGSTRRIEILEGDANEQLKKVLSQGIDWKKYKGVVFLDPFGMQVPWSTIEDLAKTKGIEIILNFPFNMAINRLLVTSGDIPQAWQDRLDETFGSKDWRGLVYEKQTDLLGKISMVKRADAAERMLEWFSGRLQHAFGFASSAQLINNTRGNPLYYLIWALIYLTQ